MSNIMDIQEIRAKYDAGAYRCDMNIPHKFSEGYIFDEELSVRKNREMLEAHNSKVDEMYREKNAKNNALIRQMREDVAAYISDTYNLNAKQASMVESFVWQEYHSFMCDYFSNVDDIADFVEGVILLK